MRGHGVFIVQGTEVFLDPFSNVSKNLRMLIGHVELLGRVVFNLEQERRVLFRRFLRLASEGALGDEMCFVGPLPHSIQPV